MYERGQAHPIVGALTYTHGPAASLARRLLQSDRNNPGFGASATPPYTRPLVTPCDDQLLHGVHDQVC